MHTLAQIIFLQVFNLINITCILVMPAPPNS